MAAQTSSVETLDELNGALPCVNWATSDSFVTQLIAKIQGGTPVLPADGNAQPTCPDGLPDASCTTNATSIVEGVAQPIPRPPRQDLQASNLHSSLSSIIDATNTAPSAANLTFDGRNSTVTAAGVVIQSATPADRGSFAHAGQVTLSNLTIQNALVRDGPGAAGGGGFGLAPGPDANGAERGGSASRRALPIDRDSVAPGASTGAEP